MKLIIFFIVGIVVLPLARAGEWSVSSSPKSQLASVEHHFKKGETLWFISLLYYGKGGQYVKIVDANHLKSTEGLKDGQVLTIPQTLWQVESADFKAHYQEVWTKHQAKIKMSAGHSAAMPVVATAVPATKVVPAPAVKTEADKNSHILVVPIPSSPIFPAGEAPARSADEGVTQ